MVNVLKFKTLFSILLCINLSFIEMANNVDPDQTAPSGAV